MPGGRYAPQVAEAKDDEEDTTYLVRKLRRLLRKEAKGEDLRAVFDELDRNGDRSITALEFRGGVKRLGLNLDEWEVREVIKHCDLDGDGQISYREFENFVEGNEMKDASVQDVLERLRDVCDEGRSYRAIRDVFEDMDEDWSGSIQADELHSGLRKFGISLTVAEADEITRRFPGKSRRGSNSIQYRDFVAAIEGKAPRSHGMKDVEGDRTATFAVRRLQQEVARCAKTRHGLDLRTVFREMDADRSGTLDRNELRAVLTKMGIKLTRSELIDVMDFFGKGEHGEIHYDDFCAFANKQDPATKRIAQRVKDEIRRLAQRRHAPPDYRRAFREIDDNDSGFISTDEFVKAMKNLGLRLSSAESRQLMNMFDEDGDGRISYREFEDFMDDA